MAIGVIVKGPLLIGSPSFIDWGAKFPRLGNGVKNELTSMILRAASPIYTGIASVTCSRRP